MKSRKNVLLIVGMVLLGMVSVAPAIGAPSAESLYVWNGIGKSTASETLSVNVETYSIPSGYTFGLTKADGSGYVPLIQYDAQSTLINITLNSANEYVATATTAGTQVGTLVLGSSSNFGFAFSSGPNTYDRTYETLSLTSNPAGKSYWQLSDSTTGMQVTLLTAAQPSAVPIPGSAFLLGSGVIGLLGIGSRKKKA